MDARRIFEGLIEPSGIDNPYPLYAALHSHGDIVPAGSGFVLVPGYDLANAVLRDPSLLVPDTADLDELGQSPSRDSSPASLTWPSPATANAGQASSCAASSTSQSR